MKRLNKKLPNLRHGFERLAPQRIQVYGNAPPAANPQPFHLAGILDGSARFHSGESGNECKTNAKLFGELDLEFPGTIAEESLGQRSQQARSVSAGSIRIHS